MGDRIITPDEDPFGRSNSIVDTRRAVLLDSVDVVMLDNPSDGRQIAGLELGGRINRTSDRASIVSELIGLAQRAGGDFARQVDQRLADRINNLPK
jgi:hypothetical protein